jgi:hypothetical protein
VESSKQEAQWVLRAQCHDREALDLLVALAQGGRRNLSQTVRLLIEAALREPRSSG